MLLWINVNQVGIAAHCRDSHPGPLESPANALACLRLGIVQVDVQARERIEDHALQTQLMYTLRKTLDGLSLNPLGKDA
jgi:hypothetical protein